MKGNCPRCESDNTTVVHSGKENNKTVWEVMHCGRCAFTWRTSEPDASINPDVRPKWAQLKDTNLDNLRQIFPVKNKPDSDILKNTK